tara:strand:- start:170 stop:343 length:174 start_codon:yes stop_codon:yes gene_type:complete
MFVESKESTSQDIKNGIALEQRRGNNETLVAWASGIQQWVKTDSLKGTIRLGGYNNG